MPSHQQVTTCLRRGGPVSKHCTCAHCTLIMCAVCGSYKEGLTTDCPGVKIDLDKQREIYETPLDYTDARGWHQGAPRGRRAPSFATTRQALDNAVVHRDEVDRVARLLIAEWERVERRAVNLSYVATFADMARVVIEDRRLACADPRSIGALAIEGVSVDHSAGLQHELTRRELTRRAIAWALADRECDDLAAVITQAGNEDVARSTKIDFQGACRRVEACDEAFRQTARKLMGLLEGLQGVTSPSERG